MNNKNMILIIVTLMVQLCFVKVAHGDVIEMLFNNREHLERYTQTIITPLGRELITDDNRLVREMRLKSLAEWREKENEMIGAFLTICGQSTNRPNYHLNDTLLVNLLIELIGNVPTRNMRQHARLFQSVPYPYLIARRDRILRKLERVDNIGEYAYLAAIVNPPEILKNRLLTSERLARKRYSGSIGIMARFGDREYEGRLVGEMDRLLNLSIGIKERLGDDDSVRAFIDSMGRVDLVVSGRDFPPKYYDFLIENLFLCGTNECFRALLEFFARSQPRLDSLGCVHREQYGSRLGHGGIMDGALRENPRDLIIVGFRNYHPQLPLLHEEYDSLRHRFLRQERDDPLEEDVIVDYMQRFLNWANREYGTNFRLESKLLFVGQEDREFNKSRR